MNSRLAWITSANPATNAISMMIGARTTTST